MKNNLQGTKLIRTFVISKKEIANKTITTMTIQEFCEIANITENQFYGIDEIQGDLNLSHNNLISLPKGFNPKVGGNLDLAYNLLTSLPAGFNPNVGKFLDLSYNLLTSLPEGFGDNVKGEIFR